MLTHLIILLDDTSVSYCHYSPTPTLPVKEGAETKMPLDILRKGILFAMKENLNIQFVYPDHKLPAAHDEVIESIDHTKIKPQSQSEDADVVVLTDWKQKDIDVQENVAYVLRASRDELKEYLTAIKALLDKVHRLNIVITDVAEYQDADIDDYNAMLEELSDCLLEQYQKGRAMQLNLLTDRMMLSEMNNCNAGVNNITLAPNGKFYVCPAYYYEDATNDIGDLENGPNIKNAQLYKLDYAPICRNCDAFQCKRCVWQNQQLTLDCNTPSHQQCVLAHLERNASRKLLQRMKEKGIRWNDCQEIKELDYLDPFNIVNKWK